MANRYSSCFYHFERAIPDNEFVQFCQQLTGAANERILSTRRELDINDQFSAKLEANLSRTTIRPTTLGRTWQDVLYVLVRICKPATVVETGVFDGLSSAYILLALAENGRGRLISIDIRNERKLPPNLDQVKTGWLVPDDLRSRWELRIDDSKAVLPQVVDETDIDLFLHDSLHTERHMFFEFTTAINGMGSGSILLSDNIEYNTAFATFVADRLHNVCTIATAENSPLPDGGRLQRDKLGGGIVQRS